MTTWKDAVRPLLAPFGAVRDFSHADFGREQVPGALSVLIDGGDSIISDEAIEKLRRVCARLPPGTVALLGTVRWLGKDRAALEGKVELFVIEGKDQFDALTHARVDAVNYDMETAEVVKQLRELHARYGLDVVRAETDTVEGFITGKATDWKQLAADLYELCPDIVDQGVGDVESLEATLEEEGRFFLWWD
jgi:hypothetical protein